MLSREALEAMLAEGCSLIEIGRRLDRHPSTVAYWMKKYGLTAVHQVRHASRGGLTRDDLEPLIERGLSVREIALELDRSASTITHWLRHHELTTKTRYAISRGAPDGVCPIHGTTPHVTRPEGSPRCAKCRSEAVSRRRRKVKQILVAEAGGKCVICGYDRCIAALEFHHTDPSTKRFNLSLGATRSLDAMREEARKCVLVCSNHHAELEAGVARLP